MPAEIIPGRRGGHYTGAMRIGWIVVAAAAIAVEAWLVVGRRSGEVAYLPPASVIAPSPEIAGPVDLTQTFVPGADGLAAITFTPILPAGPPRAPIDLELDAEGADVTATMTVATRRVRPEELADRVPFTWEIGRVEQAAGRRFRLRIASPEAPAGGGLRVAIGPPDYRWGLLRSAGRGQWGDLVFRTRATRVHVLDVLHQWQRETPGVLGSDAGLVAVFVVLNLAAAVVVGYLTGAWPA
jgi:hypothetical protein